MLNKTKIVIRLSHNFLYRKAKNLQAQKGSGHRACFALATDQTLKNNKPSRPSPSKEVLTTPRFVSPDSAWLS